MKPRRGGTGPELRALLRAPGIWMLAVFLSACGSKPALDPLVRIGDARLAAAMPAPLSESGYARGKYLVAECQRPFARPQDRWVAFVLDVSKLPGGPAGYSFTASVSGGAPGNNGGNLDFTAEGNRILLEVDMRRAGPGDAAVRVAARKGAGTVDAVHIRLGSEGPKRPLVPGETIPVKVEAPPGTESAGSAPVVAGIPFAPGQLWDAGRLSLRDGGGNPIPFQREATGTWIDGGSIQWVQFRTVAETGKNLQVVVDGGGSALPPGPPLVARKDGVVTMQAGPNRIEIAGGHSPVSAVYAGGELVAGSRGARGLYLVDSKGRTARSSDNPEITVESEGPVWACVRIEADYVTDDGEALARHITRLEAHAGKPFIGITHTLVLTRDTNGVWFREAGWELAMPAANGAGGKALFGVDGTDFSQFAEVPLEAGEGGVSIVQESHPSIGGGGAKFRIARTRDGQTGETLREGSTMGDWGGFLAARGGVFWSVKDAARQHPKEISVSPGRLGLLFFSPAGGAEMDFRTPALEARWNVAAQLDAARLAQFRGHSSNAAGWSKTHDLLLIPCAPATPPAAIAAEARRLREPVYAMADPGWIYQSGAMGPLYPCDPARFPDSEAFMRAVYKNYAGRVPGTRYNGFFDYFAGPHYGHEGRYRLTYTLLNDMWLYAARTGDRGVRQFAEGANRSFRDNYVNHWEAPGKNKGLFVDAEGGTGGWRKSDFPFYWEERTDFALGTTTSLHQFIWDYQLGGNLRSAEVVREFAAALKRHWKPDGQAWRVFMVLRVLGQAWQFTNDPELLLLLEETANRSAYDPEGEFLMTKDRPYGSSLYKTNTDVGTMVELWELLGTERWREMATRTADYWWRKRAGLTPIYRISGHYLNFLYDRTGSAAVAQTVDYNLRYANAAFNPKTGEARTLAFSSLDNVFQGIPYGMDVVARSGADRKPLASISQFDDYGSPAAWFLKKGALDRTVVFAQTPPGGEPGSLAPRLRVDALDAKSAYGLDLVGISQNSDGNPAEGLHAVKIVFPKDAPGLVYRIAPQGRGRQFAVAESNTPLVFHCGGYWNPSEFRPAYRYYFKIPENARNPSLFLEGTARFFAPGGEPWGEGRTLGGMVALPAGRPGLWSFEPVEPGLAKASGFPPFFAMNSADSWFDPGPEAIPTPEPETENAASRPGGLFVGKGSGLSIQPEDPSKPLFDPREGTLEFFFKPEWSTFDLRRGVEPVSKEILRVETPAGPWVLAYRIDPNGTTIDMGPKEPSHSFFAQQETLAAEPNGNRRLRAWNTRRIVEAGKWIHVALAWGKEEKLGGRDTYTVPALHVFVDGIGGSAALSSAQANNVPSGPPSKLVFPADLNASLGPLRVSPRQRYKGNFTPGNGSFPENDGEAAFLLDFGANPPSAEPQGLRISRDH